MKLQQTIRRILREEYQVSSFIRRRFNSEELDELIDDVDELIYYGGNTEESIYDAVREFIKERKFEDIDEFGIEQDYWKTYLVYEKKLVDYVRHRMNNRRIKEQTIKRILREDTKIPTYILRRIKFSDISDEMKKDSLRSMKGSGSIDIAVSKGATFTADKLIPWHDEDGKEYDDDEYRNWTKILKSYIIENYGKETKEYLNKVLPPDSFNNDGHKYGFWKHSEINGGSGFSEGYKTWGDLILNFGSWFPINWWEIKSELDKINEGRKIFLRPGDKYNNYGYYFSIIKVKN